MIWRARQFEFQFPRPAIVMGIVNVTPDSFYDGGQYADVGRAVDHAQELVAQGAEIIDIGGESTRPGAEQVSVAEEIKRVIPVIERLSRTGALISIDTQKPEVAWEAVQAGASIINNIAANATEPAMWDVAAGSGAGYIAMHMQGTPQTMQTDPQYENVVAEVRGFFEKQIEQLAAAGVSREKIALDVGIGFGKTLKHNLELLARLDETRVSDRPLVLGVSRKSFMGRLLKLEAPDRLAPALACSVWAAARGAEIFRTHDVAETVAALRMFEAIQEQAINVGTLD
jgi:dihydropteroate synthase